MANRADVFIGQTATNLNAKLLDSITRQPPRSICGVSESGDKTTSHVQEQIFFGSPLSPNTDEIFQVDDAFDAIHPVQQLDLRYTRD